MSSEALKDFEDESLDFVYIDANHDFPNFTFDIHNWLKKIKKGGIMSGHDFAYFSYRKFNHVKRALIAYARCYRMIPIFVCGTTTVGTRLKRDHFRSWFWVKV
jgi:predicted O-methyltransferase YrrM